MLSASLAQAEAPGNLPALMQSQLAERIGKNPPELMTGESHPHCLTLLGLGPLQNQHA
jgi:hypothetical protein